MSAPAVHDRRLHMNPVSECILRAIHADGEVRHAALSQRLGADMPVCQKLSDRLKYLHQTGWLIGSGSATRGKRWRIADAALPLLRQPGPLPKVPGGHQPPPPRPGVRGTVMGARNGLILRLVAERGTANARQLCDGIAQRSGVALPQKLLHKAVADLERRDWLLRVPDPTRARVGAVAWRLTDAAAPHVVGHSGPIPLTPHGRPLAEAPASAAAQACAPVPEPAAHAAPAARRTHEHLRAAWRPAPAAPLRPGALDFLACPSHGACR